MTIENMPPIDIYFLRKVIYREECVDIKTVCIEVYILMMENLNRSSDTE
jgi:hypothetical protein